MPSQDNKQTDPPRYAGGFFIGFGAVSGAITGGMYNGQPVPGFLIGTALGALIAFLIWILNRRAS